MEILEIKQKLSILTVLSHYGLKPDKAGMLRCPFHEDKTPSFQIYPKTNTYCCFSSNCKAGTGDVIEFIALKEKISKHEAILKAESLGGTKEKNEIAILTKSAVLAKAFSIFEKALKGSVSAKEYVESRNLTEKNEVGYVSTSFLQYHKPLIESFEKHGIIYKNKFGPGYSVFAKNSLVFPLKSADGHIAGLYFRSIENNSENKHFYLKERAGLYPGYPKVETKILILTESIIDAASLENFVLPLESYSILALYGTNGFTEEHEIVIKNLADLKEIILFFDGDEAGIKAVEKYYKQLLLVRHIKITFIETPDNEDINSLSQAYGTDYFENIFQNRKSFFSSSEKIDERQETKIKVEEENKLSVISPELLIYDNCVLKISVLGGVKLNDLDRLRVTLKVEHKEENFLPIRHNVDLYRSINTEQFTAKVAENMEISPSASSQTLEKLTQALEKYRADKLMLMQPKKKEKVKLTDKEKEEALTYLKDKNLAKNTIKDIAISGLVGEENNGFIALMTFTSRKREKPMHLMCLGASGSGKTYLQDKIAALIPEEDKLEITTLSENAFYYFGQHELSHKLLLIEDLDGVESSLYPLRELQSKKKLSKRVAVKDNQGKIKTIEVVVEGPVCISGCTTKEKIYEDNANRCILIYIDTSKKQDESVMDYQKKESAGLVNKKAENEKITLFQNCQRILKPIAVRNPYATQINLPESVFKPRRTINLLLSFIETITFYYQYQLETKQDKTTGEIYIESTIEHIEIAFEVLKEVLFRKSDELSFACRSFFERLKSHLKTEKKDVFYSKEIRSAFRLPPATIKRYLFELTSYGLLKSKGNKYQGFEYQIVDQSEYKVLTGLIESDLEAILKKIRGPVAH